MPGDYFWQCVEALAATFDGDPAAAEENLTLYERQSLSFPPEKRAAIGRQLAEVIGGLSRLKLRLADAGGGENRSDRI
jgi:hypothetical protein